MNMLYVYIMIQIVGWNINRKLVLYFFPNISDIEFYFNMVLYTLISIVIYNVFVPVSSNW